MQTQTEPLTITALTKLIEQLKERLKKILIEDVHILEINSTMETDTQEELSSYIRSVLNIIDFAVLGQVRELDIYGMP